MKRQIFKGALWTLLFRLIDRGLGFVSILVLARLLVPADFGLVAMATSICAVVELFTAFGFELALIQRPDPTREHYDSAWTLNIIASVSAALLIVLLAWPASLFYNEPRLLELMPVLAASVVVGGLENIGTVDFRRQMNFQGEFQFMAAKRLSAFSANLATALLTHSYWALIAGTVCGRVVGVALSYAMQPYRPRLSLAAAGDLIRFSGWTLFSSALVAGIQRAPHFAVGRVLGPKDLGLFVLAMELGTLPTTELAAPVNRSAMAGYSRLAKDKAAMRPIFLEIGAMVTMVALPAGMGLAVLAEPIILLLLGPKWTQAIPLVQILAFSGMLVALASNNGVACVASGRPELNTWMHASRLATLVPLMALLGMSYGAQGFAWAELLGALVGYLVSCRVGFRCVGVTWRDVLARAWRPLLVCTTMAVGMRAALSAGPAPVNAAQAGLVLLVAVPLGLLGHLALTWLVWRAAGRPAGAEAQLGALAVGFVRQKLGAGSA